MTRVRRPLRPGGATPVTLAPDCDLVCGDGMPTPTICPWRHGRQRERGRRTSTATTRARFWTARSATGSCPLTSTATLGDLQSLVEDLQNANAPVQLPNLKKPSPFKSTGAGAGWGMRAAVAGVLVVLGIAIGWGLYGNTPSPLNFTSDPGAKSDGIPAKVLTPPRQLHSLGGLTGLFEQMKAKFGDTTGYDLTIYADYASLERQDPTEPRRTLRYSY